MVAVANGVSDSAVTPVTVLAGEEASGLANSIGQYLEQLLADSPEKRDLAASLHGRLGLCAREGDVAVTIAFDAGGIAIEEGLQEADAVISGEIETLMHVLAGRANPAWELGGRRIAARPTLRRPLFGYQAYRLMCLPGVSPWSGLPRAPLVIAAGVAAAAGTLLLLRRRERGDDA